MDIYHREKKHSKSSQLLVKLSTIGTVKRKLGRLNILMLGYSSVLPYFKHDKLK